jgi:hypothetical protein
MGEAGASRVSRPLPLHVILGRLTAEARETIAEQVLSLSAVRDATSAAARQGINMVVIPIGPAFLAKTRAAKALQETLKGFRIEWIEGVGRDGLPTWDVRIGWDADAAPPASP